MLYREASFRGSIIDYVLVWGKTKCPYREVSFTPEGPVCCTCGTNHCSAWCTASRPCPSHFPDLCEKSSPSGTAGRWRLVQPSPPPQGSRTCCRPSQRTGRCTMPSSRRGEFQSRGHCQRIWLLQERKAQWEAISIQIFSCEPPLNALIVEAKKSRY